VRVGFGECTGTSSQEREADEWDTTKGRRSPANGTRAPRHRRWCADEELMGSDGFSADSALLYHRRSPSALLAIEEMTTRRCAVRPTCPCRLGTCTTALTHGTDMVRDRVVLLGNDAVRISMVRGAQSSELYRTRQRRIVYVQTGNGVVESVFGALAWARRLPRGAPRDHTSLGGK